MRRRVGGLVRGMGASYPHRFAVSTFVRRLRILLTRRAIGVTVLDMDTRIPTDDILRARCDSYVGPTFPLAAWARDSTASPLVDALRAFASVAGAYDRESDSHAAYTWHYMRGTERVTAVLTVSDLRRAAELVLMWDALHPADAGTKGE